MTLLDGSIVISQLRGSRPTTASSRCRAARDSLRMDMKGKTGTRARKKVAAAEKAAAKNAAEAAGKSTEKAAEEVDKEPRIYMNVPSNEIILAEELGAKVDGLAYSGVWRSKGTCYIPEDVVNSGGLRAFVTDDGEPRWPSWTYEHYDQSDVNEMWKKLEDEWEKQKDLPTRAAVGAVYALPYNP